MRAAIYNPYLDTLGGGERYTLSFAKVLLNNGFDVNIFWKDSSILDKFEKRFGITLNGLNTIDDIKKGEGYDLCFWVSDGSIPILHSRNNILHFQYLELGIAQARRGWTESKDIINTRSWEEMLKLLK